MYTVRYEPPGRWIVAHPTLGAYPVQFLNEQMAQQMAWLLNTTPQALGGD